MKTFLFLVSALVWSLGLATGAQAAPGDVDAGFDPNPNGYVVTATAQPDGKTIIGGNFTTVGGVARPYLARLNADGSLDASFAPGLLDGEPNAVAVQADGKIIVAGYFTSIGGTPRRGIARLDADGSLEAGFNPDVGGSGVACVTVQTDGKILLSGDFTSVGGTTRHSLARVNANGTLDAGFDPNVSGIVDGVAVQADGKILLHGAFSTVGGTPRNNIAQVNADGSLDTAFNPDADGTVHSIALQADGKILLGGSFTFIGGTERQHLARLNPDGSLDPGFDPGADHTTVSMVVQADGKIVLGGYFSNVGGATRDHLARLNSDGSLDLGFASYTDANIYAVSLQADGKILAGGGYSTINGTARSGLARLANDPATQLLLVPDTTQVQWSRGGTAPELAQAVFELSTDGGSSWTPLGAGTRAGTSASWNLTGLALPASGQIRARGRVGGGYFNGSSGLVERIATYPIALGQQAYVKASNTGSNAHFGHVAISGDTMVVGAPDEASNATGINGDETNISAAGAGAAYVFVRNGGTWTQQAYLKASNTQAGDQFGVYAVAISGDTVVVGAVFEDSNATGVNGDQSNNNATNSGAAYVFVRNGTTWTQQAYLKASNTGANDIFGASVAVSGDTIVVGAHGEDSNATGINGNQNNNSAAGAGAAYVFVRNGTTWTQQAYLKASNAGAGDNFGDFVGISGDTVAVAAWHEDSNATGVNGDGTNNGAVDSGAAYVFVRNGTTWTQQAYLKAGNTGQLDEFGYILALSGETLVVGAPSEDSNATGVNGDGTNGNAANSGAAYVFTRSGTTWNPPVYLKASNTEAGDSFGNSVAVSGDIVIVGAWQECSATTGVNGDQFDNSSLFSGAAYVFRGSGTTWTQQAYLKASNTGEVDNFGEAMVGVSGDTVVVGAVNEDSNATGVNGNEANNSASNSGAAYVFTLPPTPMIATPTSTVIDSTTATLGGCIYANGGGGIVERGVVYAPTATDSDPNVGDAGVSKAVDGGNTISFFSTAIADLTPGVAYSFKAYAINSNGFIGYTSAGTFTTLVPEIAVHDPLGNDLADGGGSVAFGGRPVGHAGPGRTFTILNPGTGPLTLGAPTATGGNAGDFLVDTTGMQLSLPAGQQTTFTVAFAPGGSGDRSTTLRILNDDAGETPFDIILTGRGLSTTQDNDGDGLNDVAEFNLGALGFDYTVAQPALVAALNDGANSAGFYDAMQCEANRIAGRNDVTSVPNTFNLYTLSQVQALNVDVPLLQRNAGTGKFTLKIGLKKTANLALPFVDFPMNGAGSDAFINAAGDLEFEFSAPDNAAFFRLETR